ncbi:MAG: magnesium transporter CorA family protein [Roseburia sp.]
MINYYRAVNGKVTQLTEAQEDCWINMIQPTEKEVSLVAERYGIEMDAMKSALDMDERSRIETDDNYTMVLVNIPTIVDDNERELYDTIPLSIFVVKKAVITVCLEPTPVLKNFTQSYLRGFDTALKSRFVLQILYRAASLFLQYLRNIDKQSDVLESRLNANRSTQNSELMELLKLEKSLLYFTTALRSNEVVMEKLFKNTNIKKYEEDEDLLEDVIVENKQAIEMANVYRGILNGMMDAFGSIISNNLNIVMKVLAIITIVLSIPTMIFSAYGMNLAAEGMPLAYNPHGFLYIVLISIALSVVVTLIFVKLKMFK